METLKEILKKEGVTLIDVRDSWEYESDHIHEAINIPLHEITGRITELKKMKGPIIFYCQQGNKSRTAYSLSRQSGMTNVYDGGGMNVLQQLKLN